MVQFDWLFYARALTVSDYSWLCVTPLGLSASMYKPPTIPRTKSPRADFTKTSPFLRLSLDFKCISKDLTRNSPIFLYILAMVVPLSSHDNSSIPIEDQNESKKLKVTIDGAVGDLVNGLKDEEFLSWKAGRREWLIVLDLVAVALVVVCGQDTRTARFANPQPGPRCNHSRPGTSSRLYSLCIH